MIPATAENRLETHQKSESDKALEQVVQRSCGGSEHGNIQSQVRWGFEQPGLGGGVPAYGKGVAPR